MCWAWRWLCAERCPHVLWISLKLGFRVQALLGLWEEPAGFQRFLPLWLLAFLGLCTPPYCSSPELLRWSCPTPLSSPFLILVSVRNFLKKKFLKTVLAQITMFSQETLLRFWPFTHHNHQPTTTMTPHHHHLQAQQGARTPGDLGWWYSPSVAGRIQVLDVLCHQHRTPPPLERDPRTVRKAPEVAKASIGPAQKSSEIGTMQGFLQD